MVVFHMLLYDNAGIMMMSDVLVWLDIGPG